MEKYNVGPDAIDSYYDFGESSHVALVYFYERGGYEGTGEACGIRSTGEIDCYNLGHCSCYGPTEDYPTNPTYVYNNLDEFLAKREHVLDYWNRLEVIEKIKEIYNVVLQ